MLRAFPYVVFVFLVLILRPLSAQNSSKTDSLFQRVQNEETDSIKIYYYDDLAWELMNTNADSAIATSKIALALARKISWKRGESLSIQSAGTFYFMKGDYASALDYFFRALKLNESIGNRSSAAHNLGSIGNLFYNQSDFKKALSYYERALNIEQQLLAQTKEEDRKQYRLNRISMWQGNIGNVYNGEGIRETDPEKKQEFFEKALYYYGMALETDKSLGDKSGISNWYSNIGVVYEQQARIATDITAKNKLFDKALDHYHQSLKLEEELANTYGLAQRIMNIGSLYNQTGRYTAAEKELLKALDLFKLVSARDDERQTLQSLSVTYEKMGKHKEALHSLKRAMLIKDSLFTEEKNIEMAKKEMSFEFEKKEAIAKAEHQKELESQKIISAEKSRKQKVIIYSIIAGLILLGAFAAYVLRSLRITQKQKNIIENQKTLVEAAKHQVEEQKKIVEEKNQDITDSINYARRIQHALLAPERLLSSYLKNYFILYKPKDIVSGDFYWARLLDENHFALVTADSTGHGVPGAIMSMLNMASLKEVTGKFSLSPDKILFDTRKLIIDYLKNDGSPEGGKDGMDCSLVVFDLKNRIMHAACANNPVWIVRNGSLTELKPDKMPVGKHDKENDPFTLHSFALQEGDMVYTVTDGFTDQFGGPKGKKFMSKPLKELLEKIAMKDLNDQKALLNSIFDDWKGSSEQVDDVTLIGIRV